MAGCVRLGLPQSDPLDALPTYQHIVGKAWYVRSLDWHIPAHIKLRTRRMQLQTFTLWG